MRDTRWGSLTPLLVYSTAPANWTHTHTLTHTHTHIYIYIYIYMCVCVIFSRLFVGNIIFKRVGLFAHSLNDFRYCYQTILILFNINNLSGHCWRSKDELVSDVLLWTPTYGQAKAGRPARSLTYSRYVRTHDVTQKTCQRR